MGPETSQYMQGKDKNMEEAYLEAYNKYADEIFKHCFFRLGDREVAKDVTQDTFLKAWEKIAAGEQVENMRAFFYKIAGNLIIDNYRKKKSTSLDVMQEEGFDVAGTGERETLLKAETSVLTRAIAELEPNYQEVIVMRYVEDLSVKDIAKMIGESENNVSVKLNRATKALKSIMKIGS